MIEQRFDKIICLHLPRRTDRLEIMTRGFREAGFLEHVEFFAGVDGRYIRPPRDCPFGGGAYGCMLSHIAVIETARLNNWETVLVFEDDVLLCPNFTEMLDRFVRSLPEQWDGLVLRQMCGFKDTKLMTVSEFALRTTGTFGRLCCAYRNTMYARLLESAHATLNGKPWRRGDRAFAHMHREFRVFVARPPLVGQVPTFSETEGRKSLKRHARL